MTAQEHSEAAEMLAERMSQMGLNVEGPYRDEYGEQGQQYLDVNVPIAGVFGDVLDSFTARIHSLAIGEWIWSDSSGGLQYMTTDQILSHFDL